MTPNDIDEVVMVGGMTRMPKIIQTVKEFLAKTPIRELIQMKWWVSVQQSKVQFYQVMLRMSYYWM